jgi:hypothetical protein
MRDRISIERLQWLHPRVKDAFKYFIEDAEEGLNITLRIVQGLRTFEEQDALYQQGRTTPGKIVTYSPAGTSYHNYGLAIDVVPITGHVVNWDYKFRNLVKFATPLAITWGGDFLKLKDLDHFEKKMGYNWRTLLDKYNRKDFIPGTELVNI